MAQAIEINPGLGGMNGKKVNVCEATFASAGSVAIYYYDLTKVEFALVTEKSATNSGEKFAFVDTGTHGIGAVVSSNATSTATVSVLLIGY